MIAQDIEKILLSEEEIENAKNVLKKFKAEVVDVIEYELPLDEKIDRNLIIIKFK